MNKNRILVAMNGVILLLATAGTLAHADTPAGEQGSSSTQVISSATDRAQHPERWGFSLGMGVLDATGNRGILWQSVNPLYDLAAYYWITPQLAIDLEGFTVNDGYSTSVENGGTVTVNVKHLEFAARYYGDLHAVLHRIEPGFIRPFATLGSGVYSMTKSSYAQGTTTPADTEIGMSLGAGLKFEVVPRSLAIELMGRWNSVTFNDTNSIEFLNSNGLSNLGGQLVSWNANVLVTF